MSAEHSREKDPVEQLLLTAYPNPERKGCPGHDVLAQLANQQRDLKDPNWYHVWHCSPCYAEFKELRDARWTREEKHAQQIRRRGWLTAAAGVVIAAGTGGWVWLAHEHQAAGVKIAQVTIDLSSVTATRGDGNDYTVKLNPLPRKLDEITIILPRFSDEGEYQVAVLRSRQPDSAVALAQANATSLNNRLTLSVRMDLSRVRAGTYLLGTRSRGRNQVYYYPLGVH